MIIDLILDRYDGDDYNPRKFYFDCMKYGGPYADNITRALDFFGFINCFIEFNGEDYIITETGEIYSAYLQQIN